ncbi:GPI transamidase component PIG-T-like [Xenia sp. Carnegie-2017]|uniref:GPI transamidase component PIG-T-like n=1 Tax=Xenia sp. Carnegie-2017 TaxID=2897299 RepID=UPI001F0348B2|nr:GPI transamidase component PIG-T-like [Xenia sp. Carnegie-2017]
MNVSTLLNMANKCSRKVCFYLILASVVVADETFHEELYVKPFKNGDVLSHFQFTTLWSVNMHDKSLFSHYNLFPKSFGQIVAKYSVEELHLSLTQGFWNTNLWGHAIQPAGPGAELIVWFRDSVLESIDEEWQDLTNVLSGQFCASLNFIKSENSASPEMSFRRQGATSSIFNDSRTLRYSSLPREIVCTENLTPWKKLLPCDSKSGLSSLFNSLMIYKVKYHSMSLHLRTICEDVDCQRPLLELRQSLSILFDPVLLTGNYDWSLRKLFGHSLRSTCPLAKTSKIYVDVTGNNTDFTFTLKPRPSGIISKNLSPSVEQFAVYDLKDNGIVRKSLSSNKGLNIIFKWKHRMLNDAVTLPYFSAHRFLTGYGQERGGIQSEIINRHKTASVYLVYFQVFPWYFRIFLHSLRVYVNDVDIRLEYVQYVPSRDRQRPTVLELALAVPADSTATVSVQFEKVFLKWTEHPPDAHHGFYLPSGVITAKILPGDSTFGLVNQGQQSLLEQWVKSSENSDDRIIRMYTEILLVSLPTPDFSMPYNVICLTCTVVAIAFGSLYNLSTKRLQEVNPREATTLLGKILKKLRTLKEKLFRSKRDVVKPTDRKKND